MTIVYLSPATDTPVGGIKVIYRHAETLSRHGLPAEVCHPHDPAFVCRWFEHAATVRRDHSFDPRGDFLVIPEIWAAAMALRCRAAGLRYALFVQNGYRIHQGADERGEAGLAQAYEGADWVLSISDDTTRLLRQRYPDLPPERLLRLLPGVGDAFAPAGAKRHWVTCMPRKLPEHAAKVCALLQGRLPEGWSLKPIDGLAEAEVAALLGQSVLFLSFSEREGLALPPMEAALAGNLVVGYTGQGSAEYFERPLFRAVAHGDIAGFAEAALQAVREVKGGLLDSEGARLQRASLAARYAGPAMHEPLLDFGRRVAALLAA